MKKAIAALLCAALLLALPGCAKEDAQELLDATVTVEAAGAQRGSLSAQCAYIGTISAEGTVYVVSLVSANVESVDVQVGDRVTEGQTLCSLDDTAARLTLESAQAAVASAEAGVTSAQAGVSSAQAGILSAQAGAAQASAAVSSAQQNYESVAAQYGGDALPVLEEQVRMAEENYENTQALYEIGAASQIEVDQAYQAMISAQAGMSAAQAGLSAALAGVDQARAGLSSSNAGSASAQAGVGQAQAGVGQAQAGVEQAKAGVASAEYQLSLYHLTSPIAGVVEAVNVTENNFTASGSAAFVISGGDERAVTFYVTDQVRQTLREGQEVTVSSGGKTYSGSVTEIAGVVDMQAGLFKIKAVIQDARDLPEGLSVELSTAAYAAEDAILIPSDALYFENGEAFVYLAVDGTAVKTAVTVGLYTADTIAVTGGLEEGDQVITTWSATLRDGAAIRMTGE